MIKNLLTVGCSFTYGEELPTVQDAWPYKLAHKLNSSVVNLGQPAASNDTIIRRTMDHVINDPTVDLVVIGWTNIGRSEFADEIGYYNVWPGYQGNLFARDGSNWRKELVEYVSKYHNPAAIHRKFIQQVMLLQAFLESKNIKYVMLNIVQNEYYKMIFFDGQLHYHEQVNKQTFIEYNQAGMIEWVEGKPKGPNGHFLEEGHIIVAEKIYEHIRNLGWVS